MPTLLCVPILVQDEPTAMADANAARDAGADIIEFRIDDIFSGTMDAAGNLDAREVNLVVRLIAQSPLPCIVTCRAAAEGGHYDGDDMARVSLYEKLGTLGGRSSRSDPNTAREHPPRYLDIEHASYDRSHNLRHKIHLAVDHPFRHRDVRSGLILSMHDFQGRPSDLIRRVVAMGEDDAVNVVKLAITARSVRDNLELFDLLSENASGKPTIALAMGRFGLMSRVLAPKFGGFLTFASLRAQSATAPGQPTVRELLDIYRFRSIHSKTKVYGLVGWPVEHSLSPLVHNAGFEALAPDAWEREDPNQPIGHDGVYLPLPVPPEYEHFKATLSVLIDHPRLDFCGCSVTIPHKEHLVRFARERIQADDDFPWEIDELSQACGAANTLVVRRDRLGSVIGAQVLNTDAKAGVEALSTGLARSGLQVAGARVGIIGAGGVARALAAGLMHAGATVVVYSRTQASAEKLAADLNAAPALAAAREGGAKLVPMDLQQVVKSCCQAMINCTPVGMTGGPAPDQSPIEIASMRECGSGCVIMDTVYNPVRTPLLLQAADAGLPTVDGLAMFVRQAGAQFHAWTGQPAPLRLFERICREALDV